MQHLKLLLVIIGVLALANAPAAAIEYDLHQAVLDNDLQLVNRLLSKGKAIDVIGSRKYGYGSALHLAVREGHVEIAQVLIDRGAQVDVLDPDDFTPLHNAAWNGNLEMTKLLLDAGADIEASTYDGDTPLKLAQNNNQPEVSEFIQAKLQALSGVAGKAESADAGDSGVIDISGSYLVDVSGEPKFITYILDGAKLEDRPVFEVVQEGDRITVTNSGAKSLYGPIFASLDGNTVNMQWVDARAKMIVKSGGKELVGTVIYTGGDNIRSNAELKLTKIESDAAPIPDVSGTYIVETTASGSGMNHDLIRVFKKLNGTLIVLKQTDNTITGRANSQSDWIPDAHELKGTREGNIINFYIIRGNEIIGSWEINADASKLEGKWFTNGAGGASGKWNLKRVK